MKKLFIFSWLRRSRCENGCGVVKSCSMENLRSWKQGSLSCRLMSCVLFREKPILNLKAVENLCGVAEAQACGIRSTAIRRWQDSNFGLIVCRNTWFLHMKTRHAAHRIRICSNRRYFKRRKQNRIVLHLKKRHTRHKIRILLALKCRHVDFTAHEKVTYPSQDPDAFEFAWPACQFFVRKFGRDCTRKSDISVTGSGCIRFYLDFTVHEKATRRSEDPDFACSCLSKTLNYCTRKSDIPVTGSGFVRILDILIFKWIRIAWPACHFFVGKFGLYCTRKSDTPVTGSGCSRSLEIQKSDFACCCLFLA